MPEFSPSEVKTARAPITVQPAGLSCSAELYLVSNGAKVATSGVKPFTSTGAKQDISLPITMPGEGAYPVYLDIFTNGLLIGAYKAVEDVVIAAPAPAPFTFGTPWATLVDIGGGFRVINFYCLVTNPTNMTLTRTFSVMWIHYVAPEEPRARYFGDGTLTKEVTLSPGGNYTVYSPYRVRWGAEFTYNGPLVSVRGRFRMWLEDEYGNKSAVITVP